jgi:hypothetical protein
MQLLFVQVSALPHHFYLTSLLLPFRLIGKELHVLVEDAFLTVEAVSKEPSYVDEIQKKKDQAKPAD